jgi:hypothetical protein
MEKISYCDNELPPREKRKEFLKQLRESSMSDVSLKWNKLHQIGKTSGKKVSVVLKKYLEWGYKIVDKIESENNGIFLKITTLDNIKYYRIDETGKTLLDIKDIEVTNNVCHCSTRIKHTYSIANVKTKEIYNIGKVCYDMILKKKCIVCNQARLGLKSSSVMCSGCIKNKIDYYTHKCPIKGCSKRKKNFSDNWCTSCNDKITTANLKSNFRCMGCGIRNTKLPFCSNCYCKLSKKYHSTIRKLRNIEN